MSTQIYVSFSIKFLGVLFKIFFINFKDKIIKKERRIKDIYKKKIIY